MCVLPHHASKQGEEGLSQVLKGGGSEVAILWQLRRVLSLKLIVGTLKNKKDNQNNEVFTHPNYLDR